MKTHRHQLIPTDETLVAKACNNFVKVDEVRRINGCYSHQKEANATDFSVSTMQKILATNARDPTSISAKFECNSCLARVKVDPPFTTGVLEVYLVHGQLLRYLIKENMYYLYISMFSCLHSSGLYVKSNLHMDAPLAQ
jgi:hypothetical protein